MSSLTHYVFCPPMLFRILLPKRSELIRLLFFARTRDDLSRRGLLRLSRTLRSTREQLRNIRERGETLKTFSALFSILRHSPDPREQVIRLQAVIVQDCHPASRARGTITLATVSRANISNNKVVPGAPVQIMA